MSAYAPTPPPVMASLKNIEAISLRRPLRSVRTRVYRHNGQSHSTWALAGYDRAQLPQLTNDLACAAVLMRSFRGIAEVSEPKLVRRAFWPFSGDLQIPVT